MIVAVEKKKSIWIQEMCRRYVEDERKGKGLKDDSEFQASRPGGKWCHPLRWATLEKEKLIAGKNSKLTLKW